MATPMMSQFAPSTFSFHAPTTSQPQNTYQPPARSPLSPALSGESYYHDSSSSAGSGSSSSSGHSDKSPMSEHSSQFAFPILSADGHLLPPLPASSRGSWNISEGDLGAGAGRPLPLAPGETSPGLYDSEAYEQYEYSTYNQSEDHSTSIHSIKAPVPLNPHQKWAYAPTNEEVVGLYPNSLDIPRNDDYEQGYEYGHGRDNRSIRSSQRVPEIQDTFGFHQPQSATYHRSFSAEGEYMRAD
jgi:hypothetical protein